MGRKGTLEGWIKEHPLIENWLSEYGSRRTRFDYSQKTHDFFTSKNITPESFVKMEVKEIKHMLLVYHAEQKKIGVPQNTVLSTITAVRSFCTNLEKQIKFKRGQIGKVTIDVNSHSFTTQDLKGMFEIGDTTQKAIIATAVSLGWEISGFISLKLKKIRGLIEHAKANGEEYVFFDDVRMKTEEPRLGVLNPLAIQWIGKYLEVTKPSESSLLFDYTQDGINKMIVALSTRSGMKTSGRVHFHRIRAWLMSQLSRAGFNEFEIKYVVGKAIPVTDATYLTTLKTAISEKYPRIYSDYLCIANGNGVTKKVRDIEEENRKLNAEVDGLKAELQDLKESKGSAEAVSQLTIEMKELSEKYDTLRAMIFSIDKKAVQRKMKKEGDEYREDELNELKQEQDEAERKMQKEAMEDLKKQKNK